MLIIEPPKGRGKFNSRPKFFSIFALRDFFSARPGAGCLRARPFPDKSSGLNAPRR